MYFSFQSIMYTLSEISRLAYLPSNERSPKTILRLHNTCFQHACFCVDFFGKCPKLTKFFGIYYHSLTTHLPEVARIIAPSSLYTESEERIFSAFRGITRSTSSRTGESVRDIGIIR